MRQIINRTHILSAAGIAAVLFTGFYITHLHQQQELFDPAGLQLTWQQDPTSTMTIDWHTTPDQRPDESILEYRKSGSEAWETITAEDLDYPFSNRKIHRVELTGLEADTNYRFRFGNNSEQYTFRTMPEHLSDRDVIFATGGDTRLETKWLEKTNTAVMDYDLDFVVWGGDLAYANGLARRVNLWHEWFEANKNTLITEDGRVIPIIAGIGNHELRRDGGKNYWFEYDNYEQTDSWRNEYAPYYFAFFPFPGQPGYDVLDFGNYMSLFLLDTDHANPVEGEQTDWLEQELQQRQEQNVRHVYPVYHVPAYPSHQDFNGRSNTEVREHWVPLFEEYGVQVAFENHDHAYKRTYPIRDGDYAADGIVYIGDGAWGVPTRHGENQYDWYINEFAGERHGIIATIGQNEEHYITVNEDGEVIDTYETDHREQLARTAAPLDFDLESNFPNPFNPFTTIRYRLPVDSHVELNVYDAGGRKVETIVDETRSQGYHAATFVAQDLASGVYVYRIVATPSHGSEDPFIETRKMTIMK